MMFVNVMDFFDEHLLQVRLDHMLRRLRVLEEASAARAPAKVSSY
jgi:hypothetical protein